MPKFKKPPCAVAIANSLGSLQLGVAIRDHLPIAMPKSVVAVPVRIADMDPLLRRESSKCTPSHGHLVRQGNESAGALLDQQHTVGEHRLLRYFASRLKPDKDATQQLRLRVTAEEFGEAFGLEPSLRYQELIEATSSLAKRQIAWEEPGGKVRWVQWLTGGAHEQGTGVVEIDFSPLVVQQLLSEKNIGGYRLVDDGGSSGSLGS